MPFKTANDTQIQSFQFHRIKGCNEWLNNITIKSTNKCHFCKQRDNTIYIFNNCEKTNTFWKTWVPFWNKLTVFDITDVTFII